MSTPFAPPSEEIQTAVDDRSDLLQANASLGQRFVGAFIDLIPNAAGLTAMVGLASLSDDPYRTPES